MRSIPMPLRSPSGRRGTGGEGEKTPALYHGQRTAKRLTVESGTPLLHHSSTSVRACQAPFWGAPYHLPQAGQARQGRPLAACLDPCRAGLTVAPLSTPGGAEAKRRPAGPPAPPGGRSPDARRAAPGGARRDPQGVERRGDPRGPGRGRGRPQSRAGRPQGARSRPRPTPQPRARTRRARPAGRAGDGARGGARNRATGAGGAAEARGHRSDPKGAEGRPGPTEPRRPPPAHRAGAREETAGAGRSPEGANEGPHRGPERPPQGPQGRAHRRSPADPTGGGTTGTGGPRGPPPITGARRARGPGPVPFAPATAHAPYT